MEQELPLVGMAREKQRLSAAYARRESLAILGPPGCGKTRLINETLCGCEGCLYVSWEPALHDLLAAIARVLVATGHPEFEKLPKSGQAEEWLSKQNSIHLKGILWTAFEKAPVTLILDGICGTGSRTYRFFQRLYHTTGMALIAAARDASGMGSLARLFWDPQRVMNVVPLNEREARRLFDLATDRFQLRNLELEDFREKALETAHGNPGLIIEMCRLATQPRYVMGRCVKFAPLRIDALIRFTG